MPEKTLKNYERGKYSKSQDRRTRKYKKNNHWKSTSIALHKGEGQKYKDAATKAGLSLRRFILTALDEKIERDGLKDVFDNAATEKKKPDHPKKG